MLYILLAVVVLVVLVIILLNLSVNFHVTYDDKSELRCTVSYLFLHKVLVPEDEKKSKKQEKINKKRKKKGKETKKKESLLSFKDTYKDKGLRAFLEDIKTTLTSLWTLILSIIRRADLKRFDVNINVAGEDAADTAVDYGYANAVVYPIVAAILDNVEECKNPNIVINPDFSEDAKPSADIKIHLKIRLLKLLAALIESSDAAEKILLANE